METPPIKFNKSFEALYNSAMTLADQCIVDKAMQARYWKLDEEYNELKECVNEAQKYWQDADANKPDQLDQQIFNSLNLKIKDELSDVLFVLLHISHKSGYTAFDLLHGAMSKMLARMNDVNYIPKN